MSVCLLAPGGQGAGGASVEEESLEDAINGVPQVAIEVFGIGQHAEVHAACQGTIGPVPSDKLTMGLVKICKDWSW